MVDGILKLSQSFYLLTEFHSLSVETDEVKTNPCQTAKFFELPSILLWLARGIVFAVGTAFSFARLAVYTIFACLKQGKYVL